MNKKFLVSALTLTLSLSFLAVFATANYDKFALVNSQGSSAITSGTITVGEGTNVLNTGSVTTNFKSSNNNNFSFSYSNVTRNDNLYRITSTSSIKNNVALHGIYRIEIYGSTSNARAYIYSGYETASEDSAYLTINSSVYTYTFETNRPNFIEIKGINSYPLSFSKIVIYYSCQEQESRYYNYFKQEKYEDVSLSSDIRNILISHSGSNLSDIESDYFAFYRTNSRKMGTDVSNISIQYVENELRNTTTVVEGAHQVNVSYTYGGFTYTNSMSITLYGFDHFEEDYSYAYLSEEEIRVKDNDNVPADLNYRVQYLGLYLCDSSNNQLTYLSFNTDYLPLSETPFTSNDEHPFSTVGDKTITITKLGFDISMNYKVYDPQVNNIRDIDCYDTITVPKQSTRATFLKIVQTLTFDVDYYEYDGYSPFEITGQSINFLVDDTTFDVSSEYLDIPFTYSTYSGTIRVELIEPDGELRNYYTSYSGVKSVVFMGLIKRVEVYEHRVKLFDNVSGTGIPTIEDEYFGYNSNGLVYGAMYQLNLSLDEENHLFWLYTGGPSLYGRLTNTDEYAQYKELELFEGYIARFYTEDGYVLDAWYTKEADTVSFNYCEVCSSLTIDVENKTFTPNYYY